MSEKVRLDALLVQRGLVESRDKAKAVIMGGHVILEGDREDKPGRMVSPDARVELRGYEKKYVSRGGYKLDKSLKVFPISLEGKVVADLGASTGGFTDCALQHGASRVYAIDVGYGQLAWKLRQDPRVVCMERTNIRYVTPEDLGEALDLSVIYVSFISLHIVLPAVQKLLKPEGQVLCLIKPQFEAGREKVGKKGVVRDPAVDVEVLEGFLALARGLGCTVRARAYSRV